jgi:hypothetical protein
MSTDKLEMDFEQRLRDAADRIPAPTSVPPMQRLRSRSRFAIGLAIAPLVLAVAVATQWRSDNVGPLIAAAPTSSTTTSPLKVVPNSKVRPCSSNQIESIVANSYLATSGTRASDVTASRCVAKYAILDHVNGGFWMRELFALGGATWLPIATVPTRPHPFLVSRGGVGLLSKTDALALQKLFGSEFFDATDPIWTAVDNIDGDKILKRIVKISPAINILRVYGRDNTGRTLVQISGLFPPGKADPTADPKAPGDPQRWGILSLNGTYRAITEAQAFDLKSYKSEPSLYERPTDNQGKPTGEWNYTGFGQPSISG